MHHEPFMIHCLAASVCPAGKCLISADTKCDVKCSATSPRWESVTTAILFVVGSGQTSGMAVVEREGSVAGKFELYKDAKGKFRFRLKAGNGEIIAVSEAYETKAAAQNGISSVQKNAPDATVADLTG